MKEHAEQPLRMLVAKLNEALSVRETFPVAISDVSGDLTAGWKLLAQVLTLLALLVLVCTHNASKLSGAARTAAEAAAHARRERSQHERLRKVLSLLSLLLAVLVQKVQILTQNTAAMLCSSSRWQPFTQCTIFWYSVYSLYWCKSTNSDAAHPPAVAQSLPDAVRVFPARWRCGRRERERERDR